MLQKEEITVGELVEEVEATILPENNLKNQVIILKQILKMLEQLMKP